MVSGLDALDQRSSGARALLDWKRDLIADLGGEGAVTAQQRALVEITTRTKLYIDHLDAWLIQQKSLINLKKRTVLPVLLQRQALADSLARHLQALGLERRARPVQSLRDYVQAAQHTPEPTPHDDATQETS
jgi:hypothetical protein